MVGAGQVTLAVGSSCLLGRLGVVAIPFGAFDPCDSVAAAGKGASGGRGATAEGLLGLAVGAVGCDIMTYVQSTQSSDGVDLIIFRSSFS